MKSYAKLFAARHVGSRNDIQNMAQNMAQIERYDEASDDFKATLAIFSRQLSEQVQQHASRLPPALVALYQDLTVKKLKFEGGACLVELPREARVEAVNLISSLTQPLDIILEVAEPNYDYVFTPDGRIFPDHGTDGWQSVVKDVDYSLYPFAHTVAEFKKIIQPYVHELATRYGFKKKKMPFMDNTGYMRECGDITHYIDMSLELIRDDFFIFPAVYLSVAQVEEIAEPYGFVSRDRNSFKFIMDSTSFIFRETVLGWGIQGAKDIEPVMGNIAQFVFEGLCEQAKNIKDVDRLVNADLNSLFYKSIYKIGYDLPSSLILARLAGNPEFEHLVAHAETRTVWGGKQTAREQSWPQLLHYLRTEVKPLV